MTDKNKDTIKDGSVELKEEDLDQVQAGAAQRSAAVPQAKPATRRTTGGGKFDFDLQLP